MRCFALLLTLWSLSASLVQAQNGASGPDAPWTNTDAPPGATARDIPKSRSEHAPIRFSVAPESDETQLTLYLQRGVTELGVGNLMGPGYYVPICPLPCAYQLSAGMHVFGVTHADLRTVKLDRALRVEHGQEVLVKYESRRWLRGLGWGLLATLVGAGTGLYWYAQSESDDNNGKLPVGPVVGSSVLVAVGLVSGLVLAYTPDKATGWVAP